MIKDTETARRCEPLLLEVQDHLRDELLPFWRTHGDDAEYGGFLTYFDSAGKPTGETVKTLVCQARMIYTFSLVHRSGFDSDGSFLSRAADGATFVIDNFWDGDHGGWFWTTERDGKVLNDSKLLYGQSFMMLALAEYAMASGDHRGPEWAVRTYETVQALAADNRHGGYYEFFERDWSHRPGGTKGGNRKSFDVHMHMMEAYTRLFEATGARIYHQRTLEMIGLLIARMLHPEHGTAVAQFDPAWRPLRQILFEDVWGSDRDADEPEGRPLNNTSYGHNIEFAWLLMQAIELLGEPDEDYLPVVKRLYEHAAMAGVDWERGGLYCEGPHTGPARECNKEFWQQAEAMVGFLDAHALLGDRRYLDAYERVHRFVMDCVVNHDVGEWYPLFDEQNNRLWDYMGHAWKINYHTVRAMIESERRLLRLCG